MVIAIVVLHVLVCLFLIAVILLQAGRGQGLSWGVFGGTPQSILGTKTASFLSRVTTGCAIIFLITCLALNLIETQKARSLLAPQKPMTRVDFSKIKEALEKAEKAQKTNQPKATDSDSAAEEPKTTTTAAELPKPQEAATENQAKPN